MPSPDSTPTPIPAPVSTNDARRQQMIDYARQFAETCPLPSPDSYDHAVQIRAPGETPAPVTPAIRREWVNGCAIIRITLTDRGQIATAQTVSEMPSGVAAPAADILRLNRFANTSGNAPGSPMLVSVGLGEPSTNSTIVSLAFN